MSRDPGPMDAQESRRGSILLVSLWAMATLASAGILQATRVSLELQWVRRIREAAQAGCLAQTGTEAAKARLLTDNPAFDAPAEPWGQILQDPIPFGPSGTFDYRIGDEQARIPLNAAPSEILERLPGFTPEAAQELIRRRSDPDGPKRFGHLAELVLLADFGFAPEALGELEPMATVHGAGPVNLNTASQEVLTLLFSYAQSPNPADLARRVGDFRESGGVFESVQEIQAKLEILPDSGDALALTRLTAPAPPQFPLLGVRSSFFRVEGRGKTSRHGMVKTVVAVLERSGQGGPWMVRGWHET